MKKFTYVEDYIEIINGDMDPTTGKQYGLFNSTPPIISLARYDVGILSSMSSSAGSNQALTDKQGELAAKIVLKYKKQLAQVGIDVTPVESPRYRIPLRAVDRRKILSLENDQIVLRFPYDTKMIDSIRDLAKLSNGTWAFDRNSKVWKLAITEMNVIASAGFAKNNQFDITEDFTKLENLILTTESIPYAIELQSIDDGFIIQNAPNSLINYVQDTVGGFGNNNLINLVDYSSVVGYSLHLTIIEAIRAAYPERVCDMLTNIQTKFDPQSEIDAYADVFEYAKMTNRFPVYVYEPNTNGVIKTNFVERYFSTDEILVVDKDQYKNNITNNVVNKKVVYFNKYNYKWDTQVPLLISGAGIMHGGEKTMLLQRAEKSVFFAAEVYKQSI
ncbi:hypothetical protein UFOVP257_103 [uncultured Caudovirales phage]|uniref:Uncharacterized protein n=1 Tax=uncultured Caudovirales phage TaxID=2100421 RepID=A0A6J5LGD1_9CAUD|nr:hypothetical protein UFOVP257_103 [uncultured Caudovirales phage]